MERPHYVDPSFWSKNCPHLCLSWCSRLMEPSHVWFKTKNGLQGWKRWVPSLGIAIPNRAEKRAHEGWSLFHPTNSSRVGMSGMKWPQVGHHCMELDSIEIVCIPPSTVNPAVELGCLCNFEWKALYGLRKGTACLVQDIDIKHWLTLENQPTSDPNTFSVESLPVVGDDTPSPQTVRQDR